MNVVILRGVLTGAPTRRELASGSVLLGFDVTTRDDDGRAASVPVAWFDPPSGTTLAEGDEVIVTGSVRRRFFRVGAATQTRTEVVADTAVRATRGRDVRRAIERVVAALA